MMDWRGRVRELLKAVSVEGVDRYRWLGTPVGRLPARVRRKLGSSELRDYLSNRVQLRLYRGFYCSGGLVIPQEHLPIDWVEDDATAFVEALSAANRGSGCWESGWKRTGVSGNEILVTRNGLTLRAHADDLNETEELRLRVPSEAMGLSPGFYLVLGNVALREDLPHVRLYVHLRPEVAARFVDVVSSALNAASLPFRLKVLAAPTAYVRCDAAVVYFAKQDCSGVMRQLREPLTNLAPELNDVVPAFTRQLAPGIGVAEDQGDGGSFGMNRCGLLAEAMIRSFERGLTGLEERLAVVDECFREVATDLDRPHLREASGSDPYQTLPISHGVPSAESVPACSVAARSYDEQAKLLAERVAESAIWVGERCGWMGYAPDPRGRITGGPGTEYNAIGPSLYSGSAGIAWFLAEAAAAFEDNALKRVAFGAIRHALSQGQATSAARTYGASFYAGALGVAWVAALIGKRLDSRQILEESRAATNRALAENARRRTSEFDVITGRAGIVLALLSLGRMLSDESCIDQARQAGLELLALARRSKRGLSWQADKYGYPHDLTGFSHGTSGVACAFAALYAHGGDENFVEAARDALAYERSWYDHECLNWPDFRLPRAVGSARDSGFACSTAWCHGAPGIGLARLFAHSVIDDAQLLDEAALALRTTYTRTRAAMSAVRADFSLCHGLSGNAMVLLLGSRMAPPWPDGAHLAKEVAEFGMTRYGDGGWPCGVRAGESPSLLIGLAGVGMFYLSLSRPGMRTPLFPMEFPQLTSPKLGTV